MAPWIHEEIIKQSDSVLESVFFLLILDEQKNKMIYAYYKKYTKESGTIPVMCIISNGTQKYRFSYKTSTSSDTIRTPPSALRDTHRR